MLQRRLALAIAALGLALGARQTCAQSLDAIYAKAKAEGALVIYAGGPAAPWEAFAKDFEARYPGIAVSVTGGFSNVLDKKIDQQLADKKLEVDFAALQTMQDFVRWKGEGVLLAYKPPGVDKIDKSFRDPDDAFFPLQVNAHVYAYNGNHVAPKDVPKSALDFLKPVFKGKVVSAYPADDDATLYDFDAIVKRHAWSYMTKYMANEPNFIQGHLGVQRSIASGANYVTFDAIPNIHFDPPYQIAFPKRDPIPIWTLTGGIFKDAPHKNAAMLFLAWYLAPEQQKRIGTWSPRDDVPPPNGWKPILSYFVVNDYRDFITNRELVKDLRARFEHYTGPVKNTGGVR
jgi:ABC-type Fe3+ transport system substrate-binding protein